MPDSTQLALFFAAALVLAVTPGPGIFYVAARALSGGRAEGVASSLGTGLGGTVHVLAGGLGVSAVVLASAELFTALKLLGAAYLVWIGLRTVRAARRDASAALGDGAAVPPVGARRAFREGVAVEALNPKTAAFFLAFVPQFVDPAAGPVAPQFALLGLASVVLNTLADVAVALAASARARRRAPAWSAACAKPRGPPWSRSASASRWPDAPRPRGRFATASSACPPAPWPAARASAARPSGSR